MTLDEAIKKLEHLWHTGMDDYFTYDEIFELGEMLKELKERKEQEKCLTNIKGTAAYKKGYKDGWNSCISDKADGWTVDYI